MNKDEVLIVGIVAGILLGVDLIVGLTLGFIEKRKRIKYLSFIRISENKGTVKKSQINRTSNLIHQINYTIIGLGILLTGVHSNRDTMNDWIYDIIFSCLFVFLVAWAVRGYKRDRDFLFSRDQENGNITVNFTLIPHSTIKYLLVKRYVGSSGAHLVTYTIILRTTKFDLKICSGLREEFAEVLEGLYGILNLQIVDKSPYDPQSPNLSREPSS